MKTHWLIRLLDFLDNVTVENHWRFCRTLTNEERFEIYEYKRGKPTDKTIDKQAQGALIKQQWLERLKEERFKNAWPEWKRAFKANRRPTAVNVINLRKRVVVK